MSHITTNFATVMVAAPILVAGLACIICAGIWFVLLLLRGRSAESRRAEHNVKQNCTNILDDVEVGIFILNADFKVAWINEAIERYFGLDREKIIGKDKRTLIRQQIQGIFEKPDKFRDTVVATYDNNTYVENFDTHVLAGENRQDRWLEHKSHPIENGVYKGGRIEHYYDITRLKNAEQQTRQHKENLDSILNSIGDHISMIDRELDILWANDVAKDLFGKDIVGKKCYQAYHQREKPCEPYPCIALKSFEDGKVHEHETEVITAGGTQKYFHCTAGVATRDQHDKPLTVVEISRDITQKKQAEKKLAKSVQQLNQFMEGIPDAAYMVGPDYKLKKWNKRFLEQSGYTAEEVRDRYVLDFIAPKHRDSIKAVIQQIMEGRLAVQQADLITKKGKPIPYSFSGAPLKDDKNKLLGLVGTGRNITKQKKTEQSLREAKNELEKVNRQLASAVKRAEALAQETLKADKAKSEFLANMSHEIRTPMNAIVGFSDILTGESLTKEQRESVNIISESAKALLLLINDILDLSKIEAGKLDIEITECSLREILNSVESMTRPKAKEKGIDFAVIEGNGLPAHVRTDPARLRQCLINLISNAVKFTDQGHVYLKASLETFDDKPMIRFDIEDTGIGIPEKEQKYIFESFAQADGTTTRRYGGTGLGLAITRRLTELLGGKLSLISEVGKGSVFSLIIPAGLDVTEQPFLDRHNVAEHCRHASEKAGKMQFYGKVLVAEDTKSNQILMDSLLRKMGLDVTIAEDGKEAFKKGLDKRFDIIFMDIQMPNMSGYQATHRLRKKGINTPIVAITAHAMYGDQQQCISAGCDDYIAKPVKRQDLMRVICKYLNPDDNAGGSRKPTHHNLQKPSKKKLESQTQKNNDEELIDADYLRRTGIDAELLNELAKTFLDSAPAQKESLEKAVHKKNAANVKSRSHTLKSAATSIGANRLAKSAEALEKSAKRNEQKRFQNLLKVLCTEFDKLLEILQTPKWTDKLKGQDESRTKADKKYVAG